MLIGDSVTYNGRTYVVVGFTPMTVTPAEIELRDPETGKRFWVVGHPSNVWRERLCVSCATSGEARTRI
jgi:hypothetical protein